MVLIEECFKDKGLLNRQGQLEAVADLENTETQPHKFPDHLNIYKNFMEDPA
jgi:hypothetical protein